MSNLLTDLGNSMQAASKTLEGDSHPDRNAQFEHINAKVKGFQKRGAPVLSIDTKKKGNVGEFKNAGREWQPEGAPVLSLTHDETIVKLIGSTKTQKGPTVTAQIDRATYKTGVKVSDTEMEELKIVRSRFHGEWNYKIQPRLISSMLIEPYSGRL